MVIAFQLDARMQIGMRKTLSMMSINAKPSIPSAQAKLPEQIGEYLGELPLRGPPMSGSPLHKHDAEGEVDQRRDQRGDPSRDLRTGLVTERREQTSERPDGRHREHDRTGSESRS